MGFGQVGAEVDLSAYPLPCLPSCSSAAAAVAPFPCLGPSLAGILPSLVGTHPQRQVVTIAVVQAAAAEHSSFS